MKSNKIIAFILAFAIAFSLVVAVPTVANASSGGSVIVDTASFTALDSYLESRLVGGLPVINEKNACWSIIDRCFSASGLGATTEGGLVACVALWNKRMNSDQLSLSAYMVLSGTYKIPTAIYAFDDSLGVYRLKEKHSGLWLVNSAGHFPYYRPETVDDTTGTEKYRTGQWAEASKFGSNSSVLWHVASYYELNEYKDQWSDVYKPDSMAIVKSGSFYWLTTTSLGRTLVLCDKYGYPYYLPAEGETAINTPNNYYQNTTNQYVDNTTNNQYYDQSTNQWITNDNSTNVNVQDGGNALVGSVVDIENGIFNMGGEVQYIDGITYNSEENSYYVDAHSEYTFDIDLNHYVTTYNIYKIDYHIDHTSITYIGQTEEYDERYEMYFELPDGRSSADLTAEDLEQLSVSFSDVVQYQRTTDNASLRRLFHFDGNTEDSSYWSYTGGGFSDEPFYWEKGASLTYMDEGTFGGSLYLDETEHKFGIGLPSLRDCSSSFILQFRYYQSHTVAPVMDSGLKIGQETVLQMNGANYYDGSGALICATSIGSWNEICIMKYMGNLYYYINGVYYHSVADNQPHSSFIEFYFGAEQQTYKKIDELRFVGNGAFTESGPEIEPGQNYTPTSVPHDTNLTLILPDGKIPIADEYMVINTSENNLLNDYGLADWSDSETVGNISTYTSFSNWNTNPLKSGIGLYNQNGVLTYGDGVTTLSPVSKSKSQVYYWESGYDWSADPVAYRAKLDADSGLFLSLQSGLDVDTPYTFTVVLADGTSSTVTFTVNSSGVITASNILSESVVSLSVSTIDHYKSDCPQWKLDWQDYWLHKSYYGILINTSESADISHMELVKGSSPEVTVTYETAMYDPGELEDSNILAVRTNQPITGYQIGGVRPSYPTKGLVYAMVENSRIRSLQQYSGSAWVEVDGRIWTGERWIPYSSFDVFTLQDFYDIIGGSGDDYEYIYTESGFWSWFQKQWNEFMKLLREILTAIQDIGGGFKSDSEEDLEKDSDTIITVFVNNIFNSSDGDSDSSNRITEDDLSDVGSVLDNVRGFFDSGFSVGQFFDEFGNSWFLAWFTPENVNALDSISGAATVSEDEDPYNMHYYYDHMNALEQSRGGDE